MFDRKKYKRLAKRQLKGRYLTAILAIAISGLILALLNASTVSEYLNEDYDYLPNFAQEISYLNPIDYNFNFSKEYEKTDFIPLFLTLAIYGILTLSLCHLFNAYYKTTEKISFAEYLRGFSLWFKGILAMFWFSLWVFLWSLLFFIPGIVKGFSYSQMFFILAENPRIKAEWDADVGDRMIKLCVIGQNLDKKAISDALDECLA